jgi:capsular exopolysaccharide synthesis family protein
VRDAEELKDLFPIPVLARVPRMPRRSSRQMDVFQIPPGVREAYRSIQAQLDQRHNGSQVILVTSASSGDGKTSTSINLSLALVAAGHRVILMDFDLRKPDIGNLLGVGPSEGLVGMLSGDTMLEDVLVPAPRLPPLSVAPAGAGQDDFLLLTALLREIGDIMRQARGLADYVIVDTAPLGEVSDALRLLPHVDDAIVVARPDNTRRHEFEQVRDLLSRGGVLPLGLVLMGVNTRGSARYYAYGDFREKGRRGPFSSLSRSPR